ncbi:MAG: M61 family metallopeptidase, partial [Bacteroidia bacterium]
MIQKLALVVTLLLSFLFAQDYHYTLSWLEPHTHTYRITVEVLPQTKGYTDFRIPSWRPGRYRLQDYSAAATNVSAQDSKGNSLIFSKVDKDTWRVKHGILDKVRFTYDIYAANFDAGSSYRGDGFAYFNPVNMFANVPGRLDEAVVLDVPSLPASWKVATQLKRTSKTRFETDSYHDFVDAPTVFAKEMKQLSFKDQGTTFYLHFHGNYQGDAAVDKAMIDGIKKICQEASAIFEDGYPFEEFHLIYRLLPFRYRHAVEHSRSVSFTLPDNVTAKTSSLVGGVFGLTAHEVFHAWNVKRIRPAALWPYDYSQPQYTTLHWFTEGITDYYADLLLVRAGLIDKENFYRRMGRTIDALDNNASAITISPSMQSYNSWFEASDYTHPMHSVSYYTSGGRLGLMIDSKMRGITKGEKGLDDVFRMLYQNNFKQDKGVPEDGVQKAIESLTGESWQDFFTRYVHGTESFNYKSILGPIGLELNIELDEASGPSRLGITRYSSGGQGLTVDRIHTKGDAYLGGVGKGDLIFMVNGEDATKVDFDKICNDLKPGDKLRLKVFRGIAAQDVVITYRGAFTPQASLLQEKGKKN